MPVPPGRRERGRIAAPFSFPRNPGLLETPSKMARPRRRRTRPSLTARDSNKSASCACESSIRSAQPWGAPFLPARANGLGRFTRALTIDCQADSLSKYGIRHRARYQRAWQDKLLPTRPLPACASGTGSPAPRCGRRGRPGRWPVPAGYAAVAGRRAGCRLP